MCLDLKGTYLKGNGNSDDYVILSPCKTYLIIGEYYSNSTHGSCEVRRTVRIEYVDKEK